MTMIGQQDRDGWVERHIRSLLAFVAVIVCLVVVALLVAIAFLFEAQPSLSAENSYRIPAICKPLASRYGVPEIVSREQAIDLMDQLNRYSRWPGVRQCRDAVIKQWVFG